VALMLAFTVFGSQPAAADGHCDVTVSPDESIQSGVDAAADGDTVCLESGTYQEQVIINKDLRLVGDDAEIRAPADMDTFSIPESGRTFRPIVFAFGGSEAGGEVTGTETVSVDISGFEIAGLQSVPAGHSFTGILLRNVDGDTEANIVRDMFSSSEETFGILVYGDSEVTIADNIVSEYSRGGIGANGDFGVSPAPVASIRGNIVEPLAGPGSWAPNGIQICFGATGEIIANITEGHSHPSATPGGIVVAAASGVLVEGNSVEGNDAGIQVFGDFFFESDLPASGTVIRGNKITMNGDGILILDGAESTEVINNDIEGNGPFAGVAVLDAGTDLAPPADTHVNFNNIVGNDAFGVESNGPLVDATCNWWGDSTGPSGDGPGDGDAVEGNVEFAPWNLVPSGFCAGGLDSPDAVHLCMDGAWEGFGFQNQGRCIQFVATGKDSR
jgi:parallel beta-helix repeat protein